MHNIKVGDTVRIEDNAGIFSGEICTVTDICGMTAIITSEAIRKWIHMKGIGATNIGCSLNCLIPFTIEEEDIDTTYDVLV